ncbi:Acetyltransferase (GNAT) family protein [Hymenobacter gelipurpurascens]|uniref:Acetyltransferase (GNAT) family protein n=1 Tax=Hymenobacter gelipurpurascens TaxID=89968 RepID=A0A212TC52_9BACT|nr:GNAT family N-acetyltransferase [Hymenobacter gelipurpurascens]SNC63416.1 Acetyltransferase (GNAT) family protein [Hymenobacter gelipurpurascens]
MHVELSLLEHWLTGWSLARGLPLPQPYGEGLVVEVGWPEQVRRYVFVEAREALQNCAAHIQDPFIYLKAAVQPAQLRRALPPAWQIELPRYFMRCPTMMAPLSSLPASYQAQTAVEHGAYVIRLLDTTGQTAAIGRVVLHRGTAVFDRIETREPHRNKGLGTSLMLALDALAQEAGVSERLLVATEAGRGLYQRLGWEVISPYSTAFLPAS